jgi:pimeloyl-ACP methyl ester carboxylesterase
MWNWLYVAIAASLLALLAIIVSRLRTPDRDLAYLKSRWATPPSRFLDFGHGLQVHYRDEGPKDAPNPIVLIHGTGASLHIWDAWAESLQQTHRVIRFDRPGFGLTGPNSTGDYSVAADAQLTRDLLDQLGVKRAVVVGSSSGGQVAWTMASQYPERVEKLVLLASAGYPRSSPLPLGYRMAMSRWIGPILAQLIPRSALDAGYLNSYSDQSKVTKEMLQRSYELFRRAGNRTAYGQTLRQLFSVDNSAAIATIRTPTLIIWGTKDRVAPVIPDAERFHHDIIGSRLVILEGCGHLPHEECPKETIAELQAFLRGEGR